MSHAAAPAAPRLPFVDTLRGFALFGVFGANLFIFSGLSYLPDEGRSAFPSAADRAVLFTERLLVENKAMGLFSFLFGMSFWLFLDRVGARGAPATALFYRRIGWLFVIGAVHGWLLWPYDILRFYALWALALPLLVRVALPTLLVLALSLAVVAPALISGVHHLVSRADPTADALADALVLAAFSHGSFTQAVREGWRYDWKLTLSLGQLAYQVGIFGRLLVGLWAARALDLSAPERHRALLSRVLVTGLIVGIPGNLLVATQALSGAQGFLLPMLRQLAVQAGFLGFTLASASGLALLWTSSAARRVLLWLAPLGQTALTAYLSQTLFGIWLFYGYPPGPHLMGRVGPARLGVLWLLGYGVQVVLARAWLRRFRFGPMEWLWRSLTYLRLQPFARGAGARS